MVPGQSRARPKSLRDQVDKTRNLGQLVDALKKSRRTYLSELLMQEPLWKIPGILWKIGRFEPSRNGNPFEPVVNGTEELLRTEYVPGIVGIAQKRVEKGELKTTGKDFLKLCKLCSKAGPSQSGLTTLILTVWNQAGDEERQDIAKHVAKSNGQQALMDIFVKSNESVQKRIIEIFAQAALYSIGKKKHKGSFEKAVKKAAQGKIIEFQTKPCDQVVDQTIRIVARIAREVAYRAEDKAKLLEKSPELRAELEFFRVLLEDHPEELSKKTEIEVRTALVAFDKGTLRPVIPLASDSEQGTLESLLPLLCEEGVLRVLAEHEPEFLVSQMPVVARDLLALNDENTRTLVLETLEKQEDAGKAILQEIRELVNDPNYELRDELLDAVVKLAKKGNQTAIEIIAIVDSDSLKGVFTELAQQDKSTAVECAERLLISTNPTIRRHAIETLLELPINIEWAAEVVAKHADWHEIKQFGYPRAGMEHFIKWALKQEGEIRERALVYVSETRIELDSECYEYIKGEPLLEDTNKDATDAAFRIMAQRAIERRRAIDFSDQDLAEDAYNAACRGSVDAIRALALGTGHSYSLEEIFARTLENKKTVAEECGVQLLGENNSTPVKRNVINALLALSKQSEHRAMAYTVLGKGERNFGNIMRNSEGENFLEWVVCSESVPEVRERALSYTGAMARNESARKHITESMKANVVQEIKRQDSTNKAKRTALELIGSYDIFDNQFEDVVNACCEMAEQEDTIALRTLAVKKPDRFRAIVTEKLDSEAEHIFGDQLLTQKRETDKAKKQMNDKAAEELTLALVENADRPENDWIWESASNNSYLLVALATYSPQGLRQVLVRNNEGSNDRAAIGLLNSRDKKVRKGTLAALGEIEENWVRELLAIRADWKEIEEHAFENKESRMKWFLVWAMSDKTTREDPRIRGNALRHLAATTAKIPDRIQNKAIELAEQGHLLALEFVAIKQPQRFAKIVLGLSEKTSNHEEYGECSEKEYVLLRLLESKNTRVKQSAFDVARDIDEEWALEAAVEHVPLTAMKFPNEKEKQTFLLRALESSDVELKVKMIRQLRKEKQLTEPIEDALVAQAKEQDVLELSMEAMHTISTHAKTANRCKTDLGDIVDGGDEKVAIMASIALSTYNIVTRKELQEKVEERMDETAGAEGQSSNHERVFKQNVRAMAGQLPRKTAEVIVIWDNAGSADAGTLATDFIDTAKTDMTNVRSAQLSNLRLSTSMVIWMSRNGNNEANNALWGSVLPAIERVVTGVRPGAVSFAQTILRDLTFDIGDMVDDPEKGELATRLLRIPSQPKTQGRQRITFA